MKYALYLSSPSSPSSSFPFAQWRNTVQMGALRYMTLFH